jgi:D-alanyl-D-alanine carboxypeptidase
MPVPKKIHKKHHAITAIFCLIIIVAAVGFVYHYTHDASSSVAHTTATSTKMVVKSSPITQLVAGFDKTQYSLNDPTSIWIVVNKHRPLNPITYAPSDLVVPNVALRSNITSTEEQMRQVTATALEQMFSAATADGVTLNVQSGYRSYSFQTTLYNSYVQEQGQATADSQSARPGYSEHQTGLAVDVGGVTQPDCNVAPCFAHTTEGIWLAANAYKYGFIIRYPPDKEAITGYIAEPWHVRYVGTSLSNEMHVSGIETLEEFFGLGAAPDYN